MAAELPEVAAPRDDAPAKPETQPDADVGLTNTEAGRRLRLGQGNAVTRSTSRSIRAIVRRNVLTRFNLLLGVLGATSARRAIEGSASGA